MRRLPGRGCGDAEHGHCTGHGHDLDGIQRFVLVPQQADGEVDAPGHQFAEQGQPLSGVAGVEHPGSSVVVCSATGAETDRACAACAHASATGTIRVPASPWHVVARRRAMSSVIVTAVQSPARVGGRSAMSAVSRGGRSQCHGILRVGRPAPVGGASHSISALRPGPSAVPRRPPQAQVLPGNRCRPDAALPGNRCHPTAAVAGVLVEGGTPPVTARWAATRRHAGGRVVATPSGTPSSQVRGHWEGRPAVGRTHVRPPGQVTGNACGNAAGASSGHRSGARPAHRREEVRHGPERRVRA